MPYVLYGLFALPLMAAVSVALILFGLGGFVAKDMPNIEYEDEDEDA